MKFAMLFISLLACSHAMASEPSVVTAAVTFERQTNPNGECGASSYGYILDGWYFKENKKKESVHGCVESVMIPLQASNCLAPKNVYDMLRAANKILLNASRAKNVNADLLIDSDGNFSVMSITGNCGK